MATAGTRTDPYKGFRFRLEIQGLQIAGFSEATVPDMSIESTSYREGTDTVTRKLSGQMSIGTLSLKRGLTDSMDLYNWFSSVSQLGADVGGRKNVSVILVDEAGNDKVRWNMSNTWPTKYSTTDFNATGSEAMIETLELEVETISRVS
ncbi:MAG: phage tail protein [Caulobacter sp.]|nr:phage tail protein [Caulobacter sp.]